MDAVFAAMWEQGLKVDEPDVIQVSLEAAGLDAPLLMRCAL